MAHCPDAFPPTMGNALPAPSVGALHCSGITQTLAYGLPGLTLELCDERVPGQAQAVFW